ncbi:hypothetical protein PPYR_08107 [Photinus pyralis]|uniref:Uncharacterized protein n=1 Tax=Photinus pyralis TaxID=7054 RepID=A0A5N4AII9_PHOPY|nr:hypothetical protein PPYR_08107 [Photinus pyralis]
MKSLIVVCALFYICTAFQFHVEFSYIQSWEHTIAPVRDQCLTESRLDRQVLYDALFTMDFPETREFKRFSSCIWSHLGYYNSTTRKINAEKIGQEVKGFTTRIAEDCYNEHKTKRSACKMIFYIIKCGIQKM